MKLSELNELIGQILKEQGDMDVIRVRSLDIDGIVQNDFIKNNIRYSIEDFSVLKTEKNGHIENKFFTIKTPFHD